MCPEDSWIEKRQFERVQAKFPVNLHELSETAAKELLASGQYRQAKDEDFQLGSIKTSTEFIKAVTENISVGGLKVLSQACFKAASYLGIDLEVEEFSARVRAIGKVVWASDQPEKESGRYTMGVFFLGIHEEDIKTVQRYIAQAKKKVIRLVD